MDDFLDVLIVQGTGTGLKINVNQTKPLGLGVTEGEEVMLSNEKIDQIDRGRF